MRQADVESFSCHTMDPPSARASFNVIMICADVPTSKYELPRTHLPKSKISGRSAEAALNTQQYSFLHSR